MIHLRQGYLHLRYKYDSFELRGDPAKPDSNILTAYEIGFIQTTDWKTGEPDKELDVPFLVHGMLTLDLEKKLLALNFRRTELKNPPTTDFQEVGIAYLNQAGLVVLRQEDKQVLESFPPIRFGDVIPLETYVMIHKGFPRLNESFRTYVKPDWSISKRL